MQAKPADTMDDDLWLANPFESLQAHADTFDTESLNDMEPAHIPFAIILLKAMKIWRESHDGQIPKTRDEKAEFKQSIKTLARKYDDELCFIEAHDNAFKCFNDETVPYAV